MKLYGSKAILINVHQTSHHHTLEELRLLPALLRSMAIVSEETPLFKHVPYSDLSYGMDMNFRTLQPAPP